MRGPGLPSIDQLAVFLSVVETGSFAAAGRKLGRATSAISYTIAHLELQLGCALLLAGVGWGNMPEPIVRDDLAAGAWSSWIFLKRPAASIICRRFIAPTDHRALRLPG